MNDLISAKLDPGTWNILSGVGDVRFSSGGCFLMDGSLFVLHNPRISAFKYA